MTSPPSDSPPDASTRRGVLRRGLGATALTVLAGCTVLDDRRTSTNSTMLEGARATTESTSATSTATDDQATAIERHRTGVLAVDVRGADGAPVVDATVDVTMRSHAFGFGTAVGARHLVEDTTAGGPYRTHLVDLFNTGVVEHRNKWRPWEHDRDRALALAATAWLRSQGLRLRGHTAIWQTFGQPVVPEDVVAKVRSEDDDRATYVARRSDQHVRDVVGHYGDAIEAWDVVNEPVHAHELTDVLDPDVPVTHSPHVRRWFRLAREAAPEPALYLNEYEILAGDNPDVREAYEALARYLQAGDGVELAGLGMQSHFDHPDEVRSPASTRQTLDRYAALGVDLQITEYDTAGDAWTDREAAEHLDSFLRTTYAHPAVTAFVMWGFYDGGHYAGRAPLFHEDWTPKPALDVYRSLVFDEWWTDESGRTDADGRYRTTAFLGRHDVVAETDQGTASTTVTVTDPDGETAVELVLD
jgi:GH35 family endo-1,4-beta-xylanase